MLGFQPLVFGGVDGVMIQDVSATRALREYLGQRPTSPHFTPLTVIWLGEHPKRQWLTMPLCPSSSLVNAIVQLSGLHVFPNPSLVQTLLLAYGLLRPPPCGGALFKAMLWHGGNRGCLDDFLKGKWLQKDNPEAHLWCRWMENSIWTWSN